MMTDYFVASPEQAMTFAAWGPAGEDVPKLEMKWVEPAALGLRDLAREVHLPDLHMYAWWSLGQGLGGIG